MTFDDYLVTGVAIAIVVMMAACLLLLRRSPGWSLADALSEETEISKVGIGGTPVVVKELRASSSRLIALLGTIVILILYIGAGLVYIYKFAKDGTAPDMTTASDFFWAGLLLFAPYVTNKVSGAVSSFSTTIPAPAAQSPGGQLETKV